MSFDLQERPTTQPRNQRPRASRAGVATDVPIATDTSASSGFDWVLGVDHMTSAAGILFEAPSAEQAELRSGIERRIRELQKLFLEEEGRFPSQESLKALRRFLDRFQWLARPGLSLDVDGNFVATWRKPEGSLALRLLSTKDIHYSLLSLERPQAWGTEPLERLFQALPAARAIAG